MSSALPAYYTDLGPFRDAFARGNPILTYHKLGPRPARVRLKGLYVSDRLFDRQLAELRAAGYTTGALEDCARPPVPARVVITFDDGYLNVLRRGTSLLARHGFRAIQFLVAGFLGKQNEWDVREGEAPEPLMSREEVREWLAAGNDIGSHTLTHPLLTRLTPEQAREEISASRKRLEDLFGRPVRHFCYPYGDWNPAVRDLVRDAGYTTACTTIAGVNTQAESPWELKRCTARYPSRSLKAVWRRLRARPVA